ARSSCRTGRASTSPARSRCCATSASRIPGRSTTTSRYSRGVRLGIRHAEARPKGASKHDSFRGELLFSPLPLRERASRPTREARRMAGRVRGYLFDAGLARLPLTALALRACALPQGESGKRGCGVRPARSSPAGCRLETVGERDQVRLVLRRGGGHLDRFAGDPVELLQLRQNPATELQ